MSITYAVIYVYIYIHARRFVFTPQQYVRACVTKRGNKIGTLNNRVLLRLLLFVIIKAIIHKVKFKLQ